MSTDMHFDTVPDLLADRSATQPDEPLLFYKDESWTYREINQRANRIAAALRDEGVRKGDQVATLLYNSPTYLALWFGILKSGGVMIPVNVNLKGDGLAYILNDARANTVILEAETREQYETARDNLEYVDDEYLMGDGGDNYRAFESLENHSSEPVEVSIEKNDDAVIVYTSGTTGMPKGVVLPHYSYLNTGQVCAKRYKFSAEDRIFTTLPLYHCNTQQATIMPALVTGSDVAMARWFSVSEFWDLVKKYEATHFKFIGTMLTALYNESKDPPQSNPARYGIGAPVPTEIHDEFENRFDVRLIEGYGLTETATTAAQNPIEAPKQGSFGTPHDHVRMTVVDEDDEPLPPGERGEIVVRPTAPWTMMSRYYGKPEATVEAWQNLWLHTGDIGYRDEEGYFYFVERKAHSIRRRGENISSAEVERILNHHPEVDESAVVGVTSELGEEDVKAYIVPRTDELSPEAVLDHLEGRLAYFKVPRYVEFTQEFPKTSTQRIEKYKLKQRGIGDAWDRREADYELER